MANKTQVQTNHKSMQ